MVIHFALLLQFQEINMASKDNKDFKTIYTKDFLFVIGDPSESWKSSFDYFGFNFHWCYINIYLSYFS